MAKSKSVRKKHIKNRNVARNNSASIKKRVAKVRRRFAMIQAADFEKKLKELQAHKDNTLGAHLDSIYAQQEEE